MTHRISPKAGFVTMTSVAALMVLGLSGTSAQAACNEAVVGAGMIVTTCSLDTKSGYKETVLNATTINILASASVNNDVAGTIAIETAGLRDSITTQVGGNSEIRGKEKGISAVDSNVVITNKETNTIIGGIVGVEFVRGLGGDVRNDGNITGGTGAGLYILNSEQGTFLNGTGGKITSGSGAGVEFNTNFGNTLQNYGVISGGGMAVGVLGGAGDETVENVGTITGGVGNAINLGNGSNILRNGKIGNLVTGMGNISGSVTMGQGNDIIENHAVIGVLMSPVAVDLGNGNNNLTNGATGVIHGEVLLGAGDDVVVNDGAIAVGIVNKNVTLGEGNNKLTNSTTGVIFGSVLAGSGNNEITNRGTIGGNISVGNGRNIITNTGDVRASILGGLGGIHTVTNGLGGKVFGGIGLGDSADTLTNNGEIVGNVLMRDGFDTLVNTGSIRGIIDLGNGDDSVINSGFMGGNISLGEGNDNLTLNRGMTLTGSIDGGLGNDTLFLDGGVAGQSQTFNNTVSNVELLDKRGAGRWVLDNGYSFSNAVGVRAGELHIATNRTVVATGGVTVFTGGTFSGQGAVQGRVEVAGTLRPGDGVTGTLTVTGNVRLSRGSFVAVSVGPGSDQTKLVVSGDLDFDGRETLILTIAPGFYQANASYDVITTGGKVNGQFASITLPAGTRFTKFKLNYLPKAVQVQVEKLGYEIIAEAYNQRQAAGGLTRGLAGAGAGSDMEVVAQAFERSGTDEAMRRALDSLSGEAWAGIGEVRGGVTRNFRALGMDRIGGNLEGIGVWGNVLQGQEDVKSDGNGERIKGEVGGLVGGVEYGFGGGKIGVMVGYGEGDLKLRSRGEGEVKLMMGGVYGGWNLGGIEVSGGVSYASGKQKVERHIGVGTVQRDVSGSEKVREYGANVGVGYGINLGMIRVTPEVGLEMARVEEKGFEENGGGAVSLSGERERSWEGRGHVRVEVSAVFHAGVVSFEPYVKGGYERVLVGKGYQDREVSFQQPGTEFNVRSTDGSKNMYMGGGGLNVGFGPVTVGVGYQQSIGGKRDERTFKGSLGIRW